jgi:hypothetical protein
LGIALYKAQQKDLQVAAFHQGSGLIFEINGQVDKVEATLEVLTGTRISSAAQFLLKKRGMECSSVEKLGCSSLRVQNRQFQIVSVLKT